MNIKGFTYAALAATAVSTAFVGTASAVAINFDQLQDQTQRSGSLSYDGNGGSLNGNDISFTYLNLDDGRSFTCSDRCMLNFTTGSNTSEGPLYSFNGGGSFTLTGTLVDDSNGQTVPGTDSTSPLLSGSFSGSQTGTRSDGTSFGFIGNGSTSVSNDFLSYIGVSNDTPFVFLNTEFSLGQTTYNGDGGFQGNISNADLTVRDVPEPSEVAMFGMGLLLVGGGLFARRRLG